MVVAVVVDVVPVVNDVTIVDIVGVVAVFVCVIVEDIVGASRLTSATGCTASSRAV